MKKRDVVSTSLLKYKATPHKDQMTFRFNPPIAMIPLVKHRNHAVNRTIAQNKKVSPKGRLSNASNSADAALELMTGFEPVTYALPKGI